LRLFLGAPTGFDPELSSEIPAQSEMVECSELLGSFLWILVAGAELLGRFSMASEGEFSLLF
jgi:hypothetical protein